MNLEDLTALTAAKCAEDTAYLPLIAGKVPILAGITGTVATICYRRILTCCLWLCSGQTSPHKSWHGNCIDKTTLYCDCTYSRMIRDTLI